MKSHENIMNIPLHFATDPYGEWRKSPFNNQNLAYPCLAFYIGGNSGKTSCLAACQHCFVPRNAFSLSPDEAKSRITFLEANGYSIVPMIPDTFADSGNYLRSGILKSNRLYDQDIVRDIGIAWTSGKPLLQENWFNLLRLASLNELNIISLTCNIMNDEEPSIHGSLSASDLSVCVERIFEYNVKVNSKDKLRLCLTHTISNHNRHSRALFSFYERASELGAHFVRLNRLIDFSDDNNLGSLVMSNEETQVFFETLVNLEVPKTIAIPTLVSSDLGVSGAEQMGIHNARGCPGGIGLFAVLDNCVYPCVEYLKEPVGIINWSLIEDSSTDKDDFINWDRNQLDRLRAKSQSSVYDGCIGHLITYNKNIQR